MSKDLVFGVGVALALVVGAAAYFHGGAQGPAGQNGRDGESLGAVNVLMSPQELLTGGKLVAIAAKLNTANRNICAIKTSNATSTGTFAYGIKSNASYVIGYQAGYGSSAGATTTLLGQVTATAATGIIDVVATSTSIGSNGTSLVLPPNSVISVNINATTSAVDSGFAPTGYCQFIGVSR